MSFINTGVIMIISVCLDCFDYVVTGRINDDLTIMETAEFLGTIETNWPKERFKLESVEDADIGISGYACDCCESLDIGQRFELNAMEIN